ncbi:MAG: guanylate kinase [Candidatus Paceibacteria bacterium]|jgi:guanylate kinase
METKKKIIVFAGPSGVGKSTLANILLHNSDTCEFSISATTRSIRLGEKHGENYYYFSEEEFKQRIETEDFLEWEEVYPNTFYGTLRSEVARINGLGRVAVFDVDVLGAVNIKKQFGDKAHLVFIKPESTEALKERLRERGTESDEQTEIRISRFEKELAYEDQFDQVIMNTTGDIKSASDKIMEIAKTYCS